jgi:hypothetical protein
MKVAYVDTSCLVAVALNEAQGKAMIKLLGRFNRLVSSNLLEAELRAVLARDAGGVDCTSLLSWIGWVYPDRTLTPEFREVLALDRLRGADLWHLACALFLKKKLGDLSFLTLDRRQGDLAAALGFDTGS